MKNTIKHLAIVALLSTVLPAQAAIQNYNFTGAIDSGFYDGSLFSGSFSFDDATIDNSGLDITGLLSFDMSLLNTSYNFASLSGTPDVSFQDGSFLGLSLNIESVSPNVNFTFVPGSLDTSDAFTFYDTSSGVGGGGSILYTTAVPVPEPETYAMFLAGLGLMGVLSRRRKIEL
jgi:hypothetical protein